MGRASTPAPDRSAADAVLLAAARRGEQAAFGELVERYQDLVCAVTYSRTRDIALSEDVAQDTFVTAWTHLDQVREPGRLRSWLCTIAANLSGKARRRAARVVLRDDLDAELVARDNPFDELAAAQTEALVSAAIARVPEKYRDVLVLYYRESRSAREVAHALDLTEAAVLQRLARGRQYLAAGVTALVERSLGAARPAGARAGFATAVVAAIAGAGVLAPSHASASPLPTRGSTMMKLLALAAALGAAGTTAYVVHARPPAVSPPHVAMISRPALPALAAVAAPHGPGPTPLVRPAPVPRPAAASARAGYPAGDEPPPLDPAPVDAATLARLHVTAGPSRGPATAPVTVVVFTDMMCKFCSDALGTLDELVDEYPGQLRIVVKQLPVHDAARLAAEAALAADAQGKFWELHDAMLTHQDDLSRDALVALATESRLDVAAFTTALDTHAFAPGVAADVAAARELELPGTPAFVINGRRAVGLLPIADIRAQIDAALADP